MTEFLLCVEVDGDGLIEPARLRDLPLGRTLPSGIERPKMVEALLKRPFLIVRVDDLLE